MKRIAVMVAVVAIATATAHLAAPDQRAERFPAGADAEQVVAPRDALVRLPHSEQETRAGNDEAVSQRADVVVVHAGQRLPIRLHQNVFDEPYMPTLLADEYADLVARAEAGDAHAAFSLARNLFLCESSRFATDEALEAAIVSLYNTMTYTGPRGEQVQVSPTFGTLPGELRSDVEMHADSMRENHHRCAGITSKQTARAVEFLEQASAGGIYAASNRLLNTQVNRDSVRRREYFRRVWAQGSLPRLYGYAQSLATRYEDGEPDFDNAYVHFMALRMLLDARVDVFPHFADDIVTVDRALDRIRNATTFASDREAADAAFDMLAAHDACCWWP